MRIRISGMRRSLAQLCREQRERGNSADAPADPASLEADYVTVSVAEGVIQIDRPRFWGSDVIVIDG
jgi:hypothetical protein